MGISPQSQAVLDRLLNGERVTSGGISIGRLSANATVLLQVLIERGDTLARESGAAQATKLRELFVRTREARDQGATAEVATAENAPLAGEQTAQANRAVSEPSPAPVRHTGWKLVRLTCRAIRGVDPSGTAVEFPFHARPTLIFGSNGSGKSSLLGAIVWALTGQVITDSPDEAENAAIFAPPRPGSDRGTRLCDWPVVVSLPQSGDPATATPECFAQLELRSANGSTMFVRRTFSAGLETSSDGTSWNRCADLFEHGIQPLDLQLSLISPTVFGRLTIDQAEDTRTLLSLMLGYDDLEALGDFVSKLAGNRTRLANEEQGDLDAQRAQLVQKLQSLPDMLPSQHGLRDRLTNLSQMRNPGQSDVAEVGQLTKRNISTAEASLAGLLGLTETGQPPPDGIADKLTTAIAALEKGVFPNFPSLHAIRLEEALPPIEGTTPTERLAAMQASVDGFLSSARSRIAQRLEWWRKETQPGSKAALLLRAAQDYDAASGQCPVCEQPITGLPIERDLAQLRKLDRELMRDLNTFFRDLVDEFRRIVPEALTALAESTAQQRIMQDWRNLCEAVIDPVFAPITARFDETVRTIVEQARVTPAETVSLLPEDAPPEFVEKASVLFQTVQKAVVALSTLQWSQVHLAEIGDALHECITKLDSEGAASLLSALSTGKQAAAAVEPLTRVRRELRDAYTRCKSIAEKEAALVTLQELEAALNELKPLAKYATNEVKTVFRSIRDKTMDNWRLLYPENASGLNPARLSLGKGRTKTVEALLGCGTCEVPGQFFANAGLQRAIALSFYFALLDQHPRGLAFVVMDDPILSLDEEHRESWSANLLRPAMDHIQVILATHQRQYLNNCKHDFRNGVVVELNPRSHPGPISWRPGFRLDRAEEELERAPTNAPNELRKYREELLSTLDAYSPASFFNPGNLTDSLLAYGRSHPLAGSGQARIVALLTDPEVTRVLDPGSHHLTEADVTVSMIRRCLEKLRQCDCRLQDELERLERIRTHERQGRALPAVPEDPVRFPHGAQWDGPISIAVLGRAAAKQDTWACDVTEDAATLAVPPGGAALALANTLDPIIRPGQWVLIAGAEPSVRDGDLVVADAGGRRLLRRVWINGSDLHLESANPVQPTKPIIAPRASTVVRRICGVLYEPLRSPGTGASAEPHEWQPRADFEAVWLRALHAIIVEGNSLAPLARRGQHVLVSAKQPVGETTLEPGGLAVLETSDKTIGNVIKRVFRRNGEWVLVSPNPVEPHAALVVPRTTITAAWPLRGVLFESVVPQAS